MIKDTIRISPDSFEGNVRVFSWDDHGFTMMYIPSLQISAYGTTKEEAKSMMDDCIVEFVTSFLDLSHKNRKEALIEMGWAQERIGRKKFSRCFVDRKGALQGLDLDQSKIEGVKEEVMSL